MTAWNQAEFETVMGDVKAHDPATRMNISLPEDILQTYCHERIKSVGLVRKRSDLPEIYERYKDYKYIMSAICGIAFPCTDGWLLYTPLASLVVIVMVDDSAIVLNILDFEQGVGFEESNVPHADIVNPELYLMSVANYDSIEAANIADAEYQAIKLSTEKHSTIQPDTKPSKYQ